MALPSPHDSVFESLKQSQESTARLAERDAEAQRRMLAQQQKSQARTLELFDANSTLPTTISQISVYHANHTRRGFLNRIFNPILSINHDQPYPLRDALQAVVKGVEKLDRLDIFEPPISIYFDRPDPTDSSTTPTDLTAHLAVREKPRVFAKSGTSVGANDGNVNGELRLRNIFGGGESLATSVSKGVRVHSAYSAAFDTPILSNPDLRFEVSGYANNAHKDWASHDQKLKGGTAQLKWLFPGSGHKHEFSYEGIWRQITSLASEASPTVRADAGDSFKSSLSHSWICDRRDYPLLPTRGFLLKSVAELAGFSALRGDVAFSKVELETQAALPVPVPFTKSDPGISLTMGLRGGAMCPLTLGSTGELTHSRISDRFNLGGPTDVRGFRLAGLGPRDGADAIGGDVYAAGGASLLVPFPKVGKEAPLRMQAFVNGGRLLGLQDTRGEDEKSKSSAMTSSDVGRSLASTMLQLGDGLPSMSAGVGVVYAIPAARFEVNFSLPLVVRKGEEARKGLSVGLGMSFL